MKKLLLLITITSLLFTSCSDDDAMTVTPQGNYKLTKEVMKNDNGDIIQIYEYEYTNGLLTKKIRADYEGNEFITTYFYDLNNKITHLINSNGTQTDFQYIGNKITSNTTTSYNNLYTQTFTYNALGQLIKTEYSQNGGSPNSILIYTYDNNSNISTINFDSVVTNSYSYDNGYNPDRLIYLDELSAIYGLDHNNVVLNNLIYTYAYVYNSANYPTKKTNYDNNVLAGSTEYTYQYL